MSCKQCEEIQEEPEQRIYYYRFGNADIGILACNYHAKQIMDVLNDVKTEELIISAKRKDLETGGGNGCYEDGITSKKKSITQSICSWSNNSVQ